MAFYSPPYKDILSANISPIAKLLYLKMEGWFNHCVKNNKPCTIWVSSLCKDLNVEINEVVDAARQLNSAGFTATYPEGKSIRVKQMYTIEQPKDARINPIPDTKSPF